ncbi:MAG: Gfo/Idh/MocA family oxidoreductase [Gemmatimonadota bacterium]
MRVGLVGAGGVGRKRAAAIAAHPGSSLVAVCDVDAAAAAQVAGACAARTVPRWEAVIDDPGTDAVVVATTHDALSGISVAALRAGKHVLCEKPVGRTPAEVAAVEAAAAASRRCFRAGYNHRFHPAVARLQQAAAAGELGPLLWVRGRYGHGGRPGYEREWRGDPERAGGGELMDQGAHLIDLSLWLLGDFAAVSGRVATAYWAVAPLEDNAFGTFRTAAGQVAHLHASWTQWRNLFSLEVCGRDGYGVAEGLGGSYGAESLRLGRRRPEGGAPEEERLDFAGEDPSWRLEWADFLAAVGGAPGRGAGPAEARRTMEWIHRLYRASATGCEQRAGA